MRTHPPLRWLALGAAIGVSVACSDSPSVTAPGSTALTESVSDAVATAIQDEYRAEQIYLRVLFDHGDVLPFYNVVVAEQRHSSSLAAIYERRGLETPQSKFSLDNVPRFATVALACAAGVVAEEENIAMYDRLLVGTLPVDVHNIFTSNRRASVERHLPAFQACR